MENTIGFSIDKELVRKSEDVAIVRQVYYLKRYKRYSLSEICKTLNGNNIKTPKGGKEWYEGTAKYIMNNSLYCGRMFYSGAEATRSDLSLMLNKK